MPTSAKPAKELADLLLDAQVEFWLQNLTSKKFVTLLETELGFVYDQLDRITLREAVSEEKVRATAHRYAIEMDIGGAIPELFGEIANQIFEFPANHTTLLSEVVPDHIASDFIQKVFEPGSVLDHTVRNVRNSEAFRGFLSDVVYTVMKGYLLEQNNLMKLSTVANSTRFLRDWLSSKAPDLSENIEERIRQLTEAGVNSSLEMLNEALGDEHYRELALNSTLNLWDLIRDWPIARYRDYVDENDLQEFMVMGYEFWLAFRESDYLKACIDAGIDFFFEKYGEESIQTIITEMGVTREMIFDELNNYLPDLAELVVENGMAEKILRRQLKRFYHSKKTLDLLGGVTH